MESYVTRNLSQLEFRDRRHLTGPGEGVDQLWVVAPALNCRSISTEGNGVRLLSVHRRRKKESTTTVGRACELMKAAPSIRASSLSRLSQTRRVTSASASSEQPLVIRVNVAGASPVCRATPRQVEPSSCCRVSRRRRVRRRPSGGASRRAPPSRAGYARRDVGAVRGTSGAVPDGRGLSSRSAAAADESPARRVRSGVCAHRSEGTATAPNPLRVSRSWIRRPAARARGDPSHRLAAATRSPTALPPLTATEPLPSTTATAWPRTVVRAAGRTPWRQEERGSPNGRFGRRVTGKKTVPDKASLRAVVPM